jgi:hypothetical protein
MGGFPSAKTIKFKTPLLGQTLLLRPSFCNEKLLSKDRIIKNSSHKTIISNLNLNTFFLFKKILVKIFISIA